MNELIKLIDKITKYGLEKGVHDDEKGDLEKHLVSLYALTFKLEYDFDHQDHGDFLKSDYPNILDNVRSNFSTFGWYHDIIDCHKILDEANVSTGDAIDDLSDIIYDLLETKWRYENNSINDAIWFLKTIFDTHTQPHILGLLKYLSDSRV